jgi:hypothetical protein
LKKPISVNNRHRGNEDEENYKFQIPNYKQIPIPKSQITNPSLGTEYNDYNGVRC